MVRAAASEAITLIAGWPRPDPRSDERHASWPADAAPRAVLVRTLRLVFMGAAVLLLAALVAWPYVASSPDRLRLVASLPQVDLDGEHDAIFGVTLTGTDRSGRRFALVAEKIRPLDPGNERVALTAPQVDTITRDGRPLRAEARAGTYDQRHEVVALEGAVRFALDRIYHLETERAVLDLESGTAEGMDDVAADGPFGRLTAQGFRIGEGGNLVLFTGSARLKTARSATAAAP